MRCLARCKRAILLCVDLLDSTAGHTHARFTFFFRLLVPCLLGAGNPAGVNQRDPFSLVAFNRVWLFSCS